MNYKKIDLSFSLNVFLWIVIKDQPKDNSFQKHDVFKIIKPSGLLHLISNLIVVKVNPSPHSILKQENVLLFFRF